MSAVLIHSNDPPAARRVLEDCITRGIESLQRQQNQDGGFGDTDRSHSNIATSYLVLAASTLAAKAVGRSLGANQSESLRDYIRAAGQFDALRNRYGTDKTFVVPILTNLAIAGLVDWDHSGTAIRGGRISAVDVPPAAHAGGQLRDPGVGGDRPGETLSRSPGAVSTAMDSSRIDRPDDEGLATDAAGKRRLPGSHTVDIVCGHESGRHRPRRS